MVEHSDYYNKNNDSSDDANPNIEKGGDSSWEQCKWNRTKPADSKHNNSYHTMSTSTLCTSNSYAGDGGHIQHGILNIRYKRSSRKTRAVIQSAYRQKNLLHYCKASYSKNSVNLFLLLIKLNVEFPIKHFFLVVRTTQEV